MHVFVMCVFALVCLFGGIAFVNHVNHDPRKHGYKPVVDTDAVNDLLASLQ